MTWIFVSAAIALVIAISSLQTEAFPIEVTPTR